MATPPSLPKSAGGPASVGAVVLLSGGLQSTVNMTLETRHALPVLALTMDYGQQAAGLEAKAAGKIAGMYGVDHRVLRLPWLVRLWSGPQSGAAGAREPIAARVPNHLGLFIGIAAAYAESLGSRRVAVGFCNELEAADNSRTANASSLIQATSAALAYSTRGPVEVACHTEDLDRARIAARGLEVGAPLESIWVCRQDDLEHCGQCEGCLRTRRAFTAAAVPEGLWPVGLEPLEE